MCEICGALGYEIRDGCQTCGAEGAVGVYLDGSGCWECSARRHEDVDVVDVLDAFGRSIVGSDEGGQRRAPLAGGVARPRRSKRKRRKH